MANLLDDVRHAARALRRSPAYTLVAVLTLTLGVAANVSVFTLVNAVFLRPPAGVPNPSELVGLYTSDFSGPLYGTSSYPDVEAFAASTSVFAGVAAYAPRGTSIGDGDGPAPPERILLDVVSPTYFSVLGVRPALGRALDANDAREGASVVVISDALWRRRFAADPAVIGTTLPVGGRPATVVGVAPPGFAGLTRAIAIDVWLPIQSAAAHGVGGAEFRERGARSFPVMARLRPGVTRERAQAEMDVVARRLHAAHPAAWTDVNEQPRRITVRAERDTRVPAQIAGPVLGMTALLVATVGLTLVVCCANVAGLALARGARRAREYAVRRSLGAGRRRLAAQVLAECVLLALPAGGLGLLVAMWIADAVDLGALPVDVPLTLDLTPDLGVVLFTVAVTVLTGVIFGLAPALRASRADLAAVIKADQATVVAGRRQLPLQRVLVVAQMAAAVPLVAAALLFVRALQGAGDMDPGFRADGVLLAEAAERVPREGERSQEAGMAFRERLLGLPGVRGVTWATTVPLGMEVSRMSAHPEGYRPARGEDMEIAFNVVGPDYFTTLGIPLRAGRDFDARDRDGAERVIVVNEAFARRYWPGVNPLDRGVSLTGPQGERLRVVGVAATGRYQSLGEAPRPYIYLPSLQMDGWGVTLHVRGDGDPRALVPAVRAAVEAARPGWSVTTVRTLEDQVAGSLLPQRIASRVLGLFGLVALLLAAVGLYGVVTYAVVARTHEIGIRVALGARPADVRRMVVRQGAVLAVVGLALGLPVAWAASRALGALLVGGGGSDPLPYLAAAGVLGTVAVLSSLPAARRAARVQPAVALRAD